MKLRKVKITKNGTVACKKYGHVPISFCKDCINCFGVVQFEHYVNCKMGLSDGYIKKEV